MKTKLALAFAVLVAFTTAYLLFRSSTENQRLQFELSEVHAQIEPLQSKLDALKERLLSKEELARLKDDQRDAIKLRGEVNSLKQSVAIAESAAITARKSAAAQAKTQPASEDPLKVDPLPENNPEARVHKTRVSTEIPSGHALVVGGWESNPGKRIFAFVQPVRIDRAGNLISDDSSPPTGSDQISVTTKWIELPNEAAEKFGFSKYLDTSGEQSVTLPDFAFKESLKQFETAEGVDLMTPPTVTTVSGRQARVSVGETRTTQAGPVEFGPRLDIIPTVSNSGQISLSMQASITEGIQ